MIPFCQPNPTHVNPTLLVVGSSNTDMVVQADHLPVPGETLLGGTFLMNPGGKGANQAVAATRLGAAVTFVAKVGDDVFGRTATEQFQAEGIDTRFIVPDPEYPSGVALITVDARGENCIVVAPGANARLQPTDAEAALAELAPGTFVLLQLETPLDTVGYVAEQARRRGARVVLNPAPAQALPDELYPLLFALTPNETEAELLTGIHVHDEATARQAAEVLRSRGVGHVVLTLGARGAYLLDDAGGRTVPAPAVTARDTTAAGDCFNGALVVALAEGRSLDEAAAFACQAAAISVTRLGAQASMPTRAELPLA
jgi:ribokinase